LQNNTQGKNSKLEVLNIDYFYNLFIKKTPSKKKTVPLKIFKKIIRAYLRVYFYELFMSKSPMYFPLGGKMKIVTYPPRFHLKNKMYIEKSFGLFWYDRIIPKFFFFVRLNKMIGKHNYIPKIQRLFKTNHDKDLLPIFIQELKKGITNKTLFRCIQI
jgi:hypothetical protein